MRKEAQEYIKEEEGHDSVRTVRAHLVSKNEKSVIKVTKLDSLIQEWLVAGSNDLKLHYLKDATEPQDIASLEDFFGTHMSGNFSMPEEINTDEKLYEGTKLSVLVNKYERNPKARRECIARWGTRCKVCECDFVERYGEIGENFIHVHHIIPLSQIGATYIIDPINHLVPVCPNCHAMIHKGRPEPYTIDQIKTFLRNQQGCTK